MINNSNPDIDGNTEINFSEFMGMMAEAEFYYLFIETFEALDSNKTGFVSAGDLNRVLCGVRDLVSDDRMSIIDTSDMDMQVDYETFADMLLGKPLQSNNSNNNNNEIVKTNMRMMMMKTVVGKEKTKFCR